MRAGGEAVGGISMSIPHFIRGWLSDSCPEEKTAPSLLPRPACLLPTMGCLP